MKRTATVNVNVSGSAPLPATAGTVRKTRRRRRQTQRLNRPIADPQKSFPFPVLPGAAQVKTLDAGRRARVTHRELLSSVKLTEAWTPMRIPLQPGLRTTFPWLSNVAKMYESYSFQNIQLDFIPTVGPTYAGGVVMAIDLDAFDYPADSYQEFVMSEGVVRTQNFQPATLRCRKEELNKLGPQRYTRAGELAPNLDIKTYDAGQIVYATMTGYGNYGTTVGELWISYTVDLFTPQPPYWEADAGEKLDCQAGVTKLAPFGAAPVQTGDAQVVVEDDSTLNFKRPGDFLFNATLRGTGIPDTDGAFPNYPYPPDGNHLTTTHLDRLVKADGTAASVNILYRVLQAGTRLHMQWPTFSTLASSTFRIAPYSSTAL